MQLFKLFSVHLLFIFVAVSRILCDITKYHEPFGDKVILLGEDFRQVLTVILLGSRSLTVVNCFFFLKKNIPVGLI